MVVFVRCFNVDEKSRWSAPQLSDHSLLKPRQDSEQSVDSVKPGKSPTSDIKVSGKRFKTFSSALVEFSHLFYHFL